MDNLIDKIKNLITPTMPRTKESLDNLEAKTKKLEKQAEYAETEANLLERASKAKKRIKAAKRGSNIRPRYILAGLALLVIIIVILAGSC